ncbi:putative S-layer protein [Candidatus Pacearchaeota archaeon]|nr:putative S-layer protein [Candidatus Pacearchaeota archaeon]
MKTKIFSLLGLSILALVMCMSLASAAVFEMEKISEPSSVENNAGSFDVQFNITITYTGASSSITVDFSGSTITTGTGSIVLANSSLNKDETKVLTATINFDSGQTGFIAGIINADPSSGTVTNFTFSVPLTEPTEVVEEPDEITDCSATGDADGDLEIRIKDINVIKGFGDDADFWYPLDEIEVEIEVENNGDEDIDDIAVEWGLYDVEAEDWIIDDEENDFNLKDGKDKTMYITFKLEDVDDLTNDDYVFYVWANGEIDDDNNTKVCASDSEEIEIVNNDDFVILDDITYPETASCGSEIQITADVWNVGDSDQDEVTVVIFNSELGINKIVEIGDINDFDSEILDTFIEIPEDAEEKTYVLSLKVFDEDHDVYKTDEDNDESKYIIRITLENCFVSSPALVSANLESGGKAGEELVVKATITNSGTKSATYTISAAGYSAWADSVSIDQPVFTLDAGNSKEVLFTFSVDQDASGENQFNIEVISGNKLVATQPVQIEIQETSTGFAGITGNVFEGKNKYLWGIGILNVILIVFIIIVAIRVSRR